MVDRGSNRKVSKNHIGGVKVGRVALCVVDRGSTLSVVDRRSNRRVSTNHIGGEKVSRIECDRSWVEQKSIKESHRWYKCQRDRVW